MLLAAVGAGAFYGGTLYERQQTANTRNAFFNGRGGTGGGPGGAGAPNGNGAGGAVFGTVKSITENTIQVSTPQNVTTVNLSDATTVMKTITGTVSELAVGDTITVRGQADASGVVTAISIQVVPPGTTFGGPRSTNGGNATQAP